MCWKKALPAPLNISTGLLTWSLKQPTSTTCCAEILQIWRMPGYLRKGGVLEGWVLLACQRSLLAKLKNDKFTKNMPLLYLTHIMRQNKGYEGLSGIVLWSGFRQKLHFTKCLCLSSSFPDEFHISTQHKWLGAHLRTYGFVVVSRWF